MQRIIRIIIHANKEIINMQGNQLIKRGNFTFIFITIFLAVQIILKEVRKNHALIISRIVCEIYSEKEYDTKRV